MAAPVIKTNQTRRNKVVMKVKRNTKKTQEILINTLTPNFEYTNAQNLVVKPNSLLKI